MFNGSHGRFQHTVRKRSDAGWLREGKKQMPQKYRHLHVVVVSSDRIAEIAAAAAPQGCQCHVAATSHKKFCNLDKAAYMDGTVIQIADGANDVTDKWRH